MIIFLISSIIAALTNFGISILLIFRGWKKAENRAFCGVTVSVALWGLGSTFALISGSKDIIFTWWQIGYIGGLYTTIFFFHFICILTNYKRRFLIPLVYLYSIIVSILIIFFRDAFFGELVWRYDRIWWFYWFKSKSLLYLGFYIFCYWVLLGYAFIILIKYYKTSQGIIKNQIKYLIVGSIVGWLGAEGVFLPKFIWNAYPYSNFLIAIYPVIFVFAMLRYRLMDISVAITRTGIFIAVYTIVLGLPFALGAQFRGDLIALIGARWWMVPLGLMAVLATVGPFIYIYLQAKAEGTLLKEQKRYQHTLKQASVGMTRIRNLNKLLALITHIVTKTVKISYVAIYLYNKESNDFVLQISRDKGRISLPRIPKDNPLISWLSLKRDPVVYEELKRQIEDSKDDTLKLLEENMQVLTASVVIPSLLENKLMGLIVLGDKMSGQIYTPEDLSVFQVLASQAALAIENAQFYEEAKDMQAQIAQAEKMATIGTMADGLSHQINNRFYALSLIAGDTIDTIKMTDTNNCTPEVKEMLDQINHALDRIQTNVVQGGEVVKGILKYTRKGEEGFEPLAMDDILDNTLEMVQYKVKLSEVDIIRDYPKDGPKIKGNMVQLQEVFFNFIDNAYDAILERKVTLNEPGYRGKITVSVKPKADNLLEVVVEDNGMGIKDQNNKKLFTPFFTTKTSSRRGTGLGLYVIEKIITESHKGKISFESQHQTGTRFILELGMA